MVFESPLHYSKTTKPKENNKNPKVISSFVIYWLYSSFSGTARL